MHCRSLGRAPCMPHPSVGSFQVAGEAGVVHQGGGEQPGAHRHPQVAQPVHVPRQRGSRLDELLGLVRRQFRQARRAEDAAAGAGNAGLSVEAHGRHAHP